MLRALFGYFESPEDQNPDFIRLVRTLLLVVIFVNAGALILTAGLLGPETRNPSAVLVLSLTLLLEAPALLLAMRRKLAMAKIAVPVALIIGITIIALLSTGVHSVGILAFPLIIVISTLLLGEKAAFTTTPLIILGVIIVAIGDLSGWNTSASAQDTGVEDIFLTGMLMYATSAVLQILIKRLNTNLQKAKENERAQVEANRELQELQAALETRVTERTTELALVNQRNQKRAQQFEAISQVARTAASLQTMDELLNRATQLISEQFGYYHVGIFFLDPNREYCILRAANSEGGARMLERGHALPVGEGGIVGYVSETGIPRIALDVDIDLAFLNNPDLPDTRAEMALPMTVAGEVIGVLDIQSKEQNAFTQDDSQVLTTLADQLASAIQNVRSYDTTRQLLAESQKLAGGYVQNTWEILNSANQRIGYHFSATSLKPLTRAVDSPQILEALNSGKIVASGGKKASLAVPIRLRGKTIGAMELRAPQGHAWNTDEIDIAEAVSERLSLAMETAIVIESTQRRAALEQATSEMSSKISTSTRIESILRTTAEELSRALGGSEVLVQIQPTMSIDQPALEPRDA